MPQNLFKLNLANMAAIIWKEKMCHEKIEWEKKSWIYLRKNKYFDFNFLKVYFVYTSAPQEGKTRKFFSIFCAILRGLLNTAWDNLFLFVRELGRNPNVLWNSKHTKKYKGKVKRFALSSFTKFWKENIKNQKIYFQQQQKNWL